MTEVFQFGSTSRTLQQELEVQVWSEMLQYQQRLSFILPISKCPVCMSWPHQ